jgi:hypothetical protein
MSLQEDLVQDLTIELQSDANFDADLLSAKVKNAINEVKLVRNYVVTGLTEQQINDDLCNLYSAIRNIALYDYMQVGASFEDNHVEPGTTRHWDDRQKLFNGIHAFVKIF